MDKTNIKLIKTENCKQIAGFYYEFAQKIAKCCPLSEKDKVLAKMVAYYLITKETCLTGDEETAHKCLGEAFMSFWANEIGLKDMIELEVVSLQGNKRAVKIQTK